MSTNPQRKPYMAICSEKTLQSNAKGFFMQFADAVADSAGEKWIKNVFGKLKSDRERIRIIYQDPTIKEIVLSTLSHVQEIYRKKSGEVSQARRLEASKAQNQGDNTKALALCCQSVLRAPLQGNSPRVDGGLSLALALWDRSEILMRLKSYTLALNDIQLALKEGLHSIYKPEAYWRMAICYKATGEEKRANVSKGLAERLLSNDSKNVQLLHASMKLEYTEATRVSRREIPRIENPHPNYPHVTKKMVIKEEENSGRFAVASEPIATGELVACEPPYVACLLPECFGTHCHHCFERLEAPVGCPDCASIAFCSTHCRDEAITSYHRFECKFLDLLIGSGMSILSHTSLRMVTQNTPERMYEICNDRKSERIYSLCTQSEKRLPDDFLQRTLMAAFLLRCLQKSGYFGYVDENVVPNENQLSVGELLLFQLQMLQFNAHEIYETNHASDHRFRSAVSKYIGVAVYPTVSLLNHDCYPGVSRHFSGKNIVIHTLRPLQTGEMIAENYGPIFTRRDLDNRQKSLSGRYWFNCRCLACSQNWPMYDKGLSDLSQRIRCPTSKCTAIFKLPTSSASNIVKCPTCKYKVDLSNNISTLNCCEEEFMAGILLMDHEEVEKGIEVLCKALDAFHRVSSPPHKQAHLGQECLRGLLADYGNTAIISHKIVK